MPSSSRGPGRGPFKAKTGVRIPVRAPKRPLKPGRFCIKILPFDGTTKIKKRNNSYYLLVYSPVV